jgi:enamine deaminase RidA (YjgF/YER057c/UK114 family)
MGRKLLLPVSLPSRAQWIVTPAAFSQHRFSHARMLDRHRIDCRLVHVESRMKELGIVLPSPPVPRANYNVVCSAPGNVLYISGHLPIMLDGTLMTGKIGTEQQVQQQERDNNQHSAATVHLARPYGYDAARHAGLNIISTLSNHLNGDLDRIVQIIKVLGIVQSTNEFQHQHIVMDGCSDLLMQVFGSKVGYHARSAIGTSTLPLNITVEVEAIVQIQPE